MIPALRFARVWFGMLLLSGGLLIGGEVLFLLVRYSLTTPAVVLEGRGALRSLGRSTELTCRRRSHVLLVVLCVGLLTLAVQSPYLVVVLSAGRTTALLAAVILPNGIAILTLPASCAVTTLLYHDLRARREGLDLQRRTEQLAG